MSSSMTGRSVGTDGRRAGGSTRVGRREAALLIAPVAVLFLVLLVAPVAFLVKVSLLAPGPAAPLTGPTSLASYAALGDAYYASILWRTLRIAGLTTVCCLVLGYPLALSITRSHGVSRSLQTVLVISPLFVSVVVRAYGWVLLLGNRGVINVVLTALGLQDRPTRLIYTEGAVVVALVEALLPFMVLSLAAVLDRMDPGFTEAARGLGDTALGAFWRVTLPLSMPGALAGSLLVFMVAMGSYATPALVGGSQVRVMVTEIYAQVTSIFNWPLGAALAIALLAVSLLIITLAGRLAGSGRVAEAL